MATHINMAIDDEIITRKEATGKTHEEIYMRGLREEEADMKERKIPDGPQIIPGALESHKTTEKAETSK